MIGVDARPSRSPSWQQKQKQKQQQYEPEVAESVGGSPLENALAAVKALAGSRPQFPLIPNDLHEALDLQEQVNASSQVRTDGGWSRTCDRTTASLC